jgi:hypothetical protein
MKLTEDNERTRGKTCSSATLSTTNSTWTDPGSNQGLRGERPYLFFFCMARQPYMGLGLLVSSRFHGHTNLRHTTVGRTPLDEGPARRRDLYLTTHNTHKRQTSMP